MTDAPRWDQPAASPMAHDGPSQLPSAAQLDEFEADLDQVDAALADLDDQH